MRTPALALLVLAAACKSTPNTPYLRVTADDGRIYYAHKDRSLMSDSGGFLAFKDLVTREPVRLKNGTYRAEMCTRGEIAARQREYLDDPKHPPRAP